MRLEGKNAVIYGAGRLGAGVAQKFVQEGARVFVVARRQEQLDAVKAEIEAAGQTIDTAALDALDERAVEAHLDDVVQRAGSVDVAFDLLSRGDRQQVPLVDMTVEDVTRAAINALTGGFVIARAAGRRMAQQGSGVILSVTSGTAVSAPPMMGSTGPADAALELFMMSLAKEVGRQGVRVVGIHTAAVAETLTAEGVAAVMDADAAAIDIDAILAGIGQMTTLGRPPSLASVTATAAFLASDDARDITGTIVNVSCGLIPG
jgi:NAD(P)-dependent dehydrogenase (short-subunit alcohol dehydrogenase family)